MEMSGAEPGCQYYEQLQYNSVWVKVGDCVYIKSHGLSKPRVARLVKVYFCSLGLLLKGIRAHWPNVIMMASLTIDHGTPWVVG